MQLKDMDIPTRQLNALKKKGYETVEQMTRDFPRKYYDFRNTVALSPDMTKQMAAIEGIFDCVTSDKKNNLIIVKTKITEKNSNEVLHVSWIGQYFMKNILKDWKSGTNVIVGGEISYLPEYNGYFITNPILFSRNIDTNKKMFSVYGKIKGISEEKLEEIITTSQTVSTEKESLPENILSKYKLMQITEAVKTIHKPDSMNRLIRAKQRILFDDMLYFCSKMEQDNRELPKGSPYGIKTMQNTTDFIKSLPYELTKDQNDAFKQITDKIRQGKRINALIQGDVGCGKTIIAFLLMVLMADSGFQSLLLAPTIVLAKQHYEELSKYMDKYGYKVAFLGGKMKAAEKKRILNGIKDGSFQMIIGTHTALGKDVVYQNLGLSITDEEHKFGVVQRNAIFKKAGFGMHTISMSATPIPRSLASTIYADTMDIYSIKSMPKGRKPVNTTIFSKETGIYKFLEREIRKNRQAYVICPLITEAEDESLMKDVVSVEETYETYKKHFEPLGIHIAVVTGKMKEEEVAEIITKFQQNEFQILISTTVIEVGVNVPNASVIVINNAERFGLAGLHQLRGRVGRGSYDSYCILNSINIENERLKTLCDTNDGFKIAEADLSLRGAGNFIGTEQTGRNRYLEQIETNQSLYKRIKQIAASLMDDGTGIKFIENYEIIHE